MVLYNIYTGSDRVLNYSEWPIIAVDRILLDKIVESYLRGIDEIRHNGVKYGIGSDHFQIYEIKNEYENTPDELNRIYREMKDKTYGAEWTEEMFSVTGKNVTTDFLNGREWGDLKEDLYNVYLNSTRNKKGKPITAVTKEEVISFVDQWHNKDHMGWLGNGKIDLTNVTRIKIFDIQLKHRRRDRGETKKYFNEEVRRFHRDGWSVEVLEQFGKEVTYMFNIGQYGMSKIDNKDLQIPRLETTFKKKDDKIFISHSSKDIDIVESFVNNILKLGLEIPASRIFCSSIEGQGVRKGQFIPDKLKEEIKLSAIVFLFISQSYKSSEVCLNELGAAWVTLEKERVIPILLNDVNFTDLGFLDVGRSGVKLDNQEALLSLIEDNKMVLNKVCNLPLVTRHVSLFISGLKPQRQTTQILELSDEEIEFKKCFEQNLEPFNRMLRKIVPAFSDGIHHLEDENVKSRLFAALAKVDFLKSLWYRYAEGDNYVTSIRRLPSGSLLISPHCKEVRISSVWISISVLNQNEFILFRSEELPPFNISSDVGGQSYIVGVLNDGTIISEAEKLNGFAIINGESVDLTDHGLEPRERDRKGHWVFLATEYHRIGVNADSVISFCKKLDSGDVEVNRTNLTKFLYTLQNSEIVRRNM